MGTPYKILLKIFVKVREVNCFEASGRTAAYTFFASGAFCVINYSAVINYGNSAVRTSLFAFFTSDTSVFTSLAGICALVLVAAIYNCLRFLRNHRNYLFGANIYAKTATYAQTGIYSSNAIFYAYSVRCTSRSAVSAAKTSVTASVGTAVYHRCRFARADAFIYCFFYGGVANSVTMHERNDVLGGLYLYTEESTYSVCCVFRARHAKVRLCFSFGESCRIVVATLESASAAVDSGERGSYIFCRFVFFYSKELDEQSEKYAKNKADTRNYAKSN